MASARILEGNRRIVGADPTPARIGREFLRDEANGKRVEFAAAVHWLNPESRWGSEGGGVCSPRTALLLGRATAIFSVPPALAGSILSGVTMAELLLSLRRYLSIFLDFIWPLVRFSSSRKLKRSDIFLLMSDLSSPANDYFGTTQSNLFYST